MNEKMKKEKRMMRIPVYAGVLFCILQIIVALYHNSQAVLMDSIYDSAEVVVLAIMMFIIPLLYKPVSEKKPFGYSQIETLFVLGKGIMLITVTIGLIFANIQMMMHGGNQIDTTFIGYFEILLCGISILVYMVLRYEKKTISSPLIDAELVGWKIDILASAGVGIAFLLSGLLEGSKWAALAPYMDQIIAIIIAIVMLPQPYKMIKESFQSIALFAPEIEIVDEIKGVCEDIFRNFAYEITFYDIIQTGRKVWIQVYIKSDSNMLDITQLQCIKELVVKQLYRQEYESIDLQITPDIAP